MLKRGLGCGLLAALLACLPAAAQGDSTLTMRRARELVPRPGLAPVHSLIPKVGAPACDTLETSDPRIHLILCSDGTWHYAKNPDAAVSEAVFSENWDTSVLNPYRTSLQDLPWRVTLSLVDSASRFACPRQVKVFSPFGMRRHRRHQGVDLPLQRGDPVYAAFDGRVRYASYNRGYGNIVVLRHESGLETYYAHLSERKVEPGDWVTAGQVVGLGGSTGRSSGPHLHFETRYRGFAFDPQWLIDFEQGLLRHGVFVLKRKYLSEHARYVPESEQEEEEIYLTEEQEKAEAERLAKEMAAARYVTVRQGDTLSRIAINNHTTISALCRLNGITPKTILRVGRKLRVR